VDAGRRQVRCGEADQFRTFEGLPDGVCRRASRTDYVDVLENPSPQYLQGDGGFR